MATRRSASLKPQLNQIRTWVQEGATDIWIAHKLGSTPASIANFRRQHTLSRDGAGADVGPGAAPAAAGPAAPAPPSRTRKRSAPATRAAATASTPAPAAEAAQSLAEPPVPRDAPLPADEREDDGGERGPRRRRGRRGGRGRRPAEADTPVVVEGVLDHGDEGHGLWLDAAVRDAAVYRANWAHVAAVTVTVTADEIVVRRPEPR